MQFKRNLRILLILLIGGMALCLRGYLFKAGADHIPVTTDEALTVLQALEVRAGEWPLLLSAQPYMFPLEVYWMAPLVNLLPRTAAGMRVLVFIEGLVFLWLSLWIVRRGGGWRKAWPGGMLILFPSVYLVMNQTAYSLPHYNSAFILALAAAWFVLRLDRDPRPADFPMAVAGGFFGALAFSNAMFSVALIAPLGVVAVWNALARRRWMRFPGFCLGAAVGGLPYGLALVRHPGAYASVTATFGWGESLRRLWDPALLRTLPVTFGFTPCLFSDSRERLEWGGFGTTVFPYLFVILLGAAAAAALYRLWKKHRKNYDLTMGLAEWAVGATLLSLILFVLSRRADAAAYRFLAPILVVFPFLMSELHRALPRYARPVVGLVVVILVVYNAATAIRLPLEWRDPDFARNIVSAPDLGPALAVLERKGIRHAVASHWAAYRIGFEADGKVVCAQPQNERFPGWPVPYKAKVDAATNVAYVLTEKIRFLKPGVFERHLRTMGVEAEKVEAGDFRVYYDFRLPAHAERLRIASGRVQVETAENVEQAFRMLDGDTGTFWRSRNLQHTNLWAEFVFDDPVDLDRVVLNYDKYGHDRAPGLRIRFRRGSDWETLHDSVSVPMDKFAWIRNKPVYGRAQQTFPVPLAGIRALRLEIANPNPKLCWTLAEVLFEGEPASNP